jgi:hypothetical protein
MFGLNPEEAMAQFLEIGYKFQQTCFSCNVVNVWPKDIKNRILLSSLMKTFRSWDLY